MEQLEYFRLFHDISEADYLQLTRRFGTRAFRKGDYITVPGQIQRELYFVRSGVQMSFFAADHKDHVIAFTYPPNLCAIPESFMFQAPSRYYLTSLTDSQLDYLTFDELQRLFDRFPSIERLFRRMTEAVLAGIINRHLDLHSLTIEERYKAFCRRNPQLLQLIPHKYIASYLSIDPTNFSKLYNTVRF